MIEDLKGIQEALRRAVPSLGGEAPRRDLWPDLARRMAGSREPRVPWLDWIVAAGITAGAVAVPDVAPPLLYLL
jgi:hypothetical protein